jgi:hypothetical protein
MGLGQRGVFVMPKLLSHFVQYAETVKLGNFDMEREFKDMRFVCEAYLQLLEKAVPGDAYNICPGKSALDLLIQLLRHYLQVKVNPVFVRNNMIHRLCGSPAKLNGVMANIPLPVLQDTFRWALGVASAYEHNT